MYFMLDENVPASVAEVLKKLGHKAEFLREYIATGSPDPVVATVSQEFNAVLISTDGDFKKIAPRIPDGQKTRFKKLSRVHLRCGGRQAAQRLEKAMSFIEAEFEIANNSTDRRMLLEIGKSYIKSNR